MHRAFPLSTITSPLCMIKYYVYFTVQPSQCGWLKIKTSGWRQVTDSNKQKQLFSEWLLWLMDELVVKLLKVIIFLHTYGIFIIV